MPSLAAALVLLLVLLPASSTAWPSTAPSGAERPVYRITLVTGDVATVVGEPSDPNAEVEVRAAPDRAGVDFAVDRGPGGELRAVPSDAALLIGSGRLDPRFFNLTQLVAWDYHDAASTEIPVMAEGAAGRGRGIGALADRPIGGGGLTAGSVPKREAAAAWAAGDAAGGRLPGAERLWLDGRVQAQLETSTAQVGAPRAWEAGLTGEGVTVAVLDTGVDAGHVDLAGRVAAERNFTDSPYDHDLHGHGTHVASILAGSGAASDGARQGMAPEARIVSGKVLDDEGHGTESGIIAGMEWAAGEAGARVVNLSLGGPAWFSGDPMSEAVARLTEETGALFVVAAANFGPAPGTVGVPAMAPQALTVGAVDDDDAVADFSSRGPALSGDRLKPELTAPGVRIWAARGDGTQMGSPEGEYTAASGTSMAAPHAAGAAALLAQRRPDWTAAQLKSALIAATFQPEEFSPLEHGTGRLDVAAALEQTVIEEDGTRHLVLAAGPAPAGSRREDAAEQRLRYRNLGDEPVRLRLSASSVAGDGEPGPENLVAFEAETVTVPAGGTATVGYTVDTSGQPPGYLSGVITGTADGTAVRTGFSVEVVALTPDTAPLAAYGAAA
ncbi:S8 family serine peptidase [Allonocardiopsis opalescens]|uniref:Subtilase family protein n=1 Tax=Allonocardiopsis opalescens TaxID=1144618 RepID=A0A2T0PXD3_9ACTN|nr:S8 family serine peptidase [Allonocardiopsis opalescens]PRX96189.1 subtilase family protein [Allonocardiopsis opalescens]